MKKTLLIVSMAVIILFPKAGHGAGEKKTSDTLALDLVLDAAGLDRRRIGPDPIQFAMKSRGDELPLLRALLADPLAAPYRVGMAQKTFIEYADSPQRLLIFTAGLLSLDIARGYLGNPLAPIDQRLLAAEDPLREALATIAERSEPFEAELPTWSELPNPHRYEVARLVSTIASAEAQRRRAFRDIPNDLDTELMYAQIIRNRFAPEDLEDYRLYVEDIERAALVAGTLDIASALEDFDDYLDNTADIPSLSWRVNTPLGTIVLETGSQDDEHSVEEPLLVVDLGGNDRYFENDKRQSRSGISVIYDRAGNDWFWQEPGRGAGAMFGIGITWDVAGNDEYRSDYLGQAASLFGATLLYDEAGDDLYSATAYSQAYSIGGCALLADLGGNDRFESIIRSQASAAPLGSAVLLNVGGNDVYTLANEPLISPSAQAPDYNTSMGQGAATGVRADLTDGRSLSGGVALLMDTEGDDVYSAGVFAQGSGFLAGTGLLVDSNGNDVYTGTWYVQGAGAHRAAGVLLDLGEGDDTFVAKLFSSQAMGHDFSLGFLLNESGNDSYTVRSLGLGVGNDNGTGVFADLSGDDVYTIESNESYGMGAAKLSKWGTSREVAPGIGLFLDLGGSDDYRRRRSTPVQNTTWTWEQKYPELDLPAEKGAGIDGEYPSPFHTGPRTPADNDDRDILLRVRKERRAYRESISITEPGQSAPIHPAKKTD